MKNKTKLNQKIQRKFTNCAQKEEGVTLVALIVTIVVMVIIAAVSIAAVYNSKIVEYAINGTQNYAIEGINENKVLEGTEKLIDSTVNKINDIVGGKITGGSEPEESKPEEPTPPPETPLGLTTEELSQDAMIGKYVDYKPQGTDYTVDGTYSGTGSNQTFAKNDDMKWRIWGVEGDKLLLISETLAGNIQLQGAEGYNNAVKILNDACSTAFGNLSYGSAIHVRSINQEDIDKVTNMTEESQRKAVNSSYGSSYTPSNNNYYPAIYAQESSKSGGGSLGRSEQSSWYSGNVSGSSTGKYTYYIYAISSYVTQTMYYALLTNMTASSTTGTNSHSNYWVASRYVWFDNTNAWFDVVRIADGAVSAYGVYNSYGGTNSPTHAVRPMVEINLDSIAIGGTGSGTASSPYSMAKR